MTHDEKKDAHRSYDEAHKEKPLKFVDKRSRAEEAAGDDPAPDESASAYPTVVAELELKLKQAQANFEAFKTQQLREFDAFRERQQREAVRQAELKTGDLLKPFLDVIDNLERAASSAEPATAEGLRQILAQLVGALEKDGCVRIATEGVPFDPATMEAVSVQPAAAPEQKNLVAAEMSGGFRLGERVLRPARVAVYR
jgi:molecular chaperone GrpE